MAAGVLQHLLPGTAGASPETLRGHTLQIGRSSTLRRLPRPQPRRARSQSACDSTFIRGCEEGERHLEVRVGNVETEQGGRQVFGAVAKAGTNVSVLVRRSLRFVGHGDYTAMTAFTDGGPGLRSILLDAGIAEPPILDWFHIAMRMQHDAQSASALWTDAPARVQAKAMIVDKVERLRGRIWNGKAKTVACAAQCRPLPTQPTQLARQLRKTVSCRSASGEFDHRRHRECPGQSTHEQVAADALVQERRRSAASALCCLQWNAGFWVRPDISCVPRSCRTVSLVHMTSQISGQSPSHAH